TSERHIRHVRSHRATPPRALPVSVWESRPVERVAINVVPWEDSTAFAPRMGTINLKAHAVRGCGRRPNHSAFESSRVLRLVLRTQPRSGSWVARTPFLARMGTRSRRPSPGLRPPSPPLRAGERAGRGGRSWVHQKWNPLWSIQKGNPSEKCNVPRGSPLRRLRLYPYSNRTGPMMLQRG